MEDDEWSTIAHAITIDWPTENRKPKTINARRKFCPRVWMFEANWSKHSTFTIRHSDQIIFINSEWTNLVFYLYLYVVWYQTASYVLLYRILSVGFFVVVDFLVVACVTKAIHTMDEHRTLWPANSYSYTAHSVKYLCCVNRYSECSLYVSPNT